METEKDKIDIIQTELSEINLHIEFTRKKDERICQLDRSAFRLLAELNERGPMRITRLAELFQLDNSTVSRQTAALVSKGYIQRVPYDKDGRISLLKVTPAGNAKFEEVRKARQDLYRELLSDWDQEDQKKFGDYLIRLNKAIVKNKVKYENA